MADVDTPGDELTLYVLAHMYRHVYVFKQMFWWTMLLYTIPITEKELMAQCDNVLVYIWDGVFGELETIRGPASMPKMSTNSPPKLPAPLEKYTRYAWGVRNDRTKSKQSAPTSWYNSEYS